MKVFFKLAFLFIFLSHYASIAGISSSDKIDNLLQKGTTLSEKVYFASTLKELVDALGHDRKIVVTNDIYIDDQIKEVVTDTDKFFMKRPGKDGIGGSPEYINEFYDIVAGYWSGVDTKEKLIANNFSEFIEDDIILVVKNARNLTITTNNNSSIIINQSENEVVRFDNLTKFTLLNLSIFHEVETDGGCGEFAPVISFYNSSTIVVDHCKLNGSGTEGIHTNKVNDLTVVNTDVFNCNKRGFSFEHSTDITIKNSNVYENNLEADPIYYSGPCIFYLKESEVKVIQTSITSNNSLTETPYSIVDDKSSITYKECYISDNENFTTSAAIHDASVEKLIEPVKSDDSIYKQYKSYYVTAKSGLNYRASPKGKLLGKFPANTKITVIEYPKVLDQITDEDKIVKGEWVGIQHKGNTVYVFDAFLSQYPVELNLNIYNLSPYSKGIYNSPNVEIRTAFVNISETYFENKKYDYLISRDDLTDTVTLSSRLRERFLKTVHIAEEDTIFIYEMDTDSIHSYNVKDMPVIACPNIYAYDDDDDTNNEYDYEFGFDLGKLDINYDNFVYIGKNNPFQTNQLKPIIWKEIDGKKFPKKFDVNVVDKDIRYWFDGATTDLSYTFKHNDYEYYIQNLKKDKEIYSRYIVILEANKVIYEDIYIRSEGTYLNPLNFGNQTSDYGGLQWTGALFKDKPSILFGFESHSFGCSSIIFLNNTEPSIRILCDNRH